MWVDRHVESLLFMSEFNNQIYIGVKNQENHISRKSVQWEPSWSIQTDKEDEEKIPCSETLLKHFERVMALAVVFCDAAYDRQMHTQFIKCSSREVNVIL